MSRPHAHSCPQCSRCGQYGTHTYACSQKKKPPERGHKASTWHTPEPCREIDQPDLFGEAS